MGASTQTIVFGGGCFWCTEAVFLRLKGVVSVTSGYTGGSDRFDGFDRFDPFDKLRAGRLTASKLTASRLTTSGNKKPPTYEEVSTGKTGHAEVIRVEYDPSVIEFAKLLEVFFSAYDPTTLNRQGADIGTQYRSVIFYTDESQRREAERSIAGLNEQKKYPAPVVTSVEKLDRFWPAEEYHRNFYARNPDEPYSQAVIRPKMEKLEREYKGLLKG